MTKMTPDYAMEQAMMTAHAYLEDALSKVGGMYENRPSHVELMTRHGDIIAAFMNAAALDLHTAVVGGRVED